MMWMGSCWAYGPRNVGRAKYLVVVVHLVVGIGEVVLMAAILALEDTGARIDGGRHGRVSPLLLVLVVLSALL